MDLRLVRAEEAAVETAQIERFYRHGWHSWSPTGWVDPLEGVRPIPDEGRRLGHDDPVYAFDTRVGGSGVGVARCPGGEFVLLGALAPGARVSPDGNVLRGTSEGGEIDWVVASGAMNEVFDAYTGELSGRLGRRGRGEVRVWCSWYSYYEDISEDAIARIVGDSAPYPFDILQIDDGWEVGIGDWQPNPDFPNGMEPMAELITSSGREAGLWLAPLIAGADSQLAHDRPELLLRDTHGRPVVSGINWGGPYYSLDPTSDATEEFLTDLITTVRSWGFTYLKLDFLYAAGFPGDHARPMPRDLAYRHAAEVMRRAAGDDCYLLACGAPVIASTGVFDGLRIGPDVAEFWEDERLSAMGDASGRGARNAIATSSERLWLRDLFDADPDVVYLDRSEVDLDPRTLQSLQDLARITGFVGVSDKLGDLTPEEGERLVSLLTDEPRISRRSDQRWAIDRRDVDFDWVQSDAASVTPGEVR
ncbi:MAG: glycoside hydrolase family 36 protein [Acidimicrobiia bacterium]